jgi:preprotein translocase subunit SecD
VAEERLEVTADIIEARLEEACGRVLLVGVRADSIAMRVPEQDADRLMDLARASGRVSFRPVLGRPGPGLPPGDLPTCADPDTYPDDAPERTAVFCFEQEPGHFVRLSLGPSVLTGEHVTDARAVVDPTGQSAGMYVDLSLNAEGAARFAEITSQLACDGKEGKPDQLAIVLDGLIRSAPSMGEVECGKGIEGGQAIITGMSSDAEARDLAVILRHGALQVPLEVSSVTEVSGENSTEGS